MRCPICGAEHARDMRICPEYSGKAVCTEHCRNECEYYYHSDHFGGCQYRRWHTWTNDEQTKMWIDKITSNIRTISAEKAEATAGKAEHA